MLTKGETMVCGFCKGEPVTNAAAWIDGKRHAPARCPRCDEIHFGMKAITLWQPWAWAVVAGHKRVENRSWSTDFRGTVAIHAGSTYDKPGAEWMRDSCGGSTVVPDELPRQAIIGHVDIVDVLADGDHNPDDFWAADFPGFKWVLANPVEFVDPVPCKGQQGFWTPRIGERR